VGDTGRAERLERRAGSLRQQIAAAAERIAAPQAQQSADPLEQASRQAHETFREVTRQRMAEAQQGRPGPRPFESVSRAAGRSTEHTGPDCWVCAEGRRRDAARGARQEWEDERAWRAANTDGNPYLAQGYYDATEVVRGTEGAIMGVR
jgi:hypothetical protein